MKRSITGLWVLLLMLGATCAQAQPLPASILAGLGNADYQVRERTTQELLASTTLSMQDLADLYAGARSPEQRCRLMSVALHYTIRQVTKDATAAAPGLPANASLGIMISAGLRPAQLPEVHRAAVRVATVYPGFPAFVALESGDLITGVNGEGLSGSGDNSDIIKEFISHIKANRPGDPMTLSVLREGQTIEVALTPVNYIALEMIYQGPALNTGRAVSDDGLRGPVLERWLATEASLQTAAGRPAPTLMVRLPTHPAESSGPAPTPESPAAGEDTR